MQILATIHEILPHHVPNKFNRPKCSHYNKSISDIKIQQTPEKPQGSFKSLIFQRSSKNQQIYTDKIIKIQ